MVLDDIIYLCLLFICVACGPYVKNITNQKRRQLISTVIGFVVVTIVSGFHVIHPIIVTFVNAIIIFQVDKNKCHVASFFFSFSYLLFFRITEYFGLPAVPTHTNAVQMILTLKMVGLAFEVHALHLQRKSSVKDKTLKEKYTEVDPSFLDVFQYAFCFAGVLIGPYYKYRTYHDSLNVPYIHHVPTVKFLKDRIKVVPLYLILYLIGSYIFPLEFAMSSDILQESFWYRVFYMSPQFFNFRMRIYVGFILGECICISCGLGVYPISCNPQPGAGPTNYEALQKVEQETTDWSKLEYSFETITNINEYGSEFFPTIREGIRSWNRTVQYWLATFVYKNMSASKPIKILITMSVSSFWHGVHAGYYLCLMSAPLFLFVEVEVEKAFRNKSSFLQLQLFNWIWWVIKMQSFSYMGMAFLLLDIHSIFHYWKSIYFIGHIFIVVVYFIACYKNTRSKMKTA